MRGTFIVFEGGEGSGKSSMSRFVVEQLVEEGVNAIRTREPGGSPYAELIRDVILHEHGKHADAETMFGLFWAGRRDHMRHTIIPALTRGAVIICDRFDASTYAYQIHGQEQPQLEHHFWRMRSHYVEPHVPNCYIIFDVDSATGLARAKGRQDGSTHFDDRELAFHERIRAGYSRFVNSSESHIPHAIINANLPLLEVRNNTLNLVHQLLA